MNTLGIITWLKKGNYYGIKFICCIGMLGICLRYDYTCCSRMNAPHLPFSCKFNDNETLASYARGIYDYYDVEQIEEFVAFMGAYEIESLFKECETFDDSIYRPENLAILKYWYENYKYNYDIDEFIKKVSAIREETDIL